MNIEARKISLAQRLFAIQQENILDKIDALLTREASSLSKDQKKAIDKGILELDNGDKIPHDEVMADTKKRYPNLFS